MLQTLPRLRRTGSTSPGLRLVARLAIAAGAGACAFALFSWSAHAADWQRDGAYDTSRGRPGTFHQQTARQPSLRDRQTQWTNRNGGSVSRDSTLTRTADGYDQTVTFTGPGGNARTVSRDIDIEWPASP